MPSAVDHVEAALARLTREDLAALPLARRRRLADRCRHLADLAEPRPPEPTSGVLDALKSGARAE